MNDEAYLRSLLSRAWEPGSDGKGLVLADGTLRTWTADASGNVHHSPAMEMLGLQYAEVIAYLSIRSDGAVTLWPTGASHAGALAVAALSADERLRLAPDGECHFE